MASVTLAVVASNVIEFKVVKCKLFVILLQQLQSVGVSWWVFVLIF